MRFTLRAFANADVAAVREIDRISFAPDDQYDPAFYDEITQTGLDAAVAAAADGTIVAWALADPLRRPVRIRSVSVRPEFRRQGIARALVARVLQRYTGEVDLLVEPQNAAALALYEVMGFSRADADPQMPGRLRMIRRDAALYERLG